jgi:3-methylcrotonyl-CoA carboxylase alpha subunit
VKYVTRYDGEQREFVFEETAQGLVARCGDRSWPLDLSLIGDGQAFSLLVGSNSYDIQATVERSKVTMQMIGERYVVEVEDDREHAAHLIAGNKPSGRREVRAVMPGIVAALKVAAGDEVAEGQTLVVLEAMKMQNPLAAEAPGRVTKVHCKAGASVAAGALLIELE